MSSASEMAGPAAGERPRLGRRVAERSADAEDVAVGMTHVHLADAPRLVGRRVRDVEVRVVDDLVRRRLGVG